MAAWVRIRPVSTWRKLRGRLRLAGLWPRGFESGPCHGVVTRGAQFCRAVAAWVQSRPDSREDYDLELSKAGGVVVVGSLRVTTAVSRGPNQVSRKPYELEPWSVGLKQVSGSRKKPVRKTLPRVILGVFLTSKKITSSARSISFMREPESCFKVVQAGTAQACRAVAAWVRIRLFLHKLRGRLRLASVWPRAFEFDSSYSASSTTLEKEIAEEIRFTWHVQISPSFRSLSIL